MTKEAGAVTGELDLEPTLSGDRLEVRFTYADSDEWYIPRGSPIPATTRDVRQAHQAVLARLTTPGPKKNGHEQSVDPVGLRL